MRYVVYYCRSFILLVLAVLAGFLFAPRIGVWPTITLFAVAATAAVVVGAKLLTTSTTGTITWKNRIASYCIPWGWTLAIGKLGPVQITSAIVWVLLGSVGVLLASPSPSFDVSARFGSPTLLGSLVAIAWIVDGAALLYLVSTMLKNFQFGSQQALSLMKVMGICSALLLGSVALWMSGHPYLALLVAGAPPLALAVVVALLLLVMLTAGKNARWN